MNAIRTALAFARCVVNPNYSTDDTETIARAAAFRVDVGGLAIVAGVPVLALAIPFLG